MNFFRIIYIVSVLAASIYMMSCQKTKFTIQDSSKSPVAQTASASQANAPVSVTPAQVVTVASNNRLPTSEILCLNNQTKINGVCVNNPPVCNTASNDFINGQCLTKCLSNQYREVVTNVCKNSQCSNGASNFPSCSDCGVGKRIDNGACVSNKRACITQPYGTFGGFEEFTNGNWSSCKEFIAATCALPSQLSWGGGCRANNAAQTISYGQSVNLSNVSDLANSGAIQLSCEILGNNVAMTTKSESCDVKPVYAFERLEIEYASPMRRLSNQDSAALGIKGRLLEAGNQTFIKGTSQIAFLEDITKLTSQGNWFNALSDPNEGADIVDVASVTLVECVKNKFPQTCRSASLNADQVSWKFSDAQGGSSLYDAGTGSWVCVDNGLSVSDKRGFVDCGARGAVALMITDNPNFPNVWKRGSIKSSNSRGIASGRISVKATVLSSTPNFGQYAGSSGEYSFELENRTDIRITSNMTEFTGYGRLIHWINGIGRSGLNDAFTLQSKSCTAVAANGTNLPVQFETYNGNNQFAIESSAISQLPLGTTVVKITCTALPFGGQQASEATYVKIVR